MPGYLYNFGLSQEDERTESAALVLEERARVLSICSAGEMPLGLVALGAEQVDAIDIDEGQLHLAWLKRAAVLTLEREEAIRFLGYLEATDPRERLAALDRVSRELPESSRIFWRSQSAALRDGVIWAGRYERYVRRLVRLVRPLLGRRLDGLFRCLTLEEQRAYFERRFDRGWTRALFALAFHPRIYSRRGMDPRSLQHRRTGSLGLQFFERFRWLCTRSPVAENHLLQLHLLGHVLDAGAVPAYLTEAGFETLRRRIDRLTLRRLDLAAALAEGPAGRYDGYHLSNLPDWMPEDGFAATMRLLVGRSAHPARAVWRFIHVDRQVPAELAGELRIDRALGHRLTEHDRFPFYTIVPAAIGSPA